MNRHARTQGVPLENVPIKGSDLQEKTLYSAKRVLFFHAASLGSMLFVCIMGPTTSSVAGGAARCAVRAVWAAARGGLQETPLKSLSERPRRAQEAASVSSAKPNSGTLRKQGGS